jgi:peptidyl-prolyl cis-trans isomerase D
MKPWMPLLILAVTAGCDSASPPAPTGVNAQGEPDRIRVLHVLIAFRGADRAEDSVTRSQDEAEVLAKEVLARARRGEDFQRLIKAYTSDHGDGNYRVVNHGVIPRSGDSRRAGLVPGFCDVAFALKVGEVGLVPHDRTRSPYGYHVIKRIE